MNDKQHALDGFEKIEYINNSPDTLKFIWFHVWPNAYKNDKTAFTDQSLENGNTKFYFSNKEERGYINKLEFKVNDQTASTEDHPQHIDIIKLVLPSPLPPGQKIIITTPFHVKLPLTFHVADMMVNLTRQHNGILNLQCMIAKAGILCPILTRENFTVSLEILMSA